MESNSLKTNLGLLILRVSFGSMMLFGHGWGKFVSFAERAPMFPDPLGVGPSASLGMAIFAELFCAGLVVFGLFTRLAVIPLMITMAVASFIIHGDDPFARKEMALMYLSVFASLFVAGGGDFTLQRFFRVSATSRIAPLNWLLK